MNILDLLISIPGPQFLLIFAIFAAGCIGIAWWWVYCRDDSIRYSLPGPTKLDAMEIAVLRGGENAAIRAAVFDLWRQRWLIFRKDSKKAKMKSVLPKKHAAIGSAVEKLLGIRVPAEKSAETQPEGFIQKAIYDFAQTECEPAQLFSDQAFLQPIKAFVAPIADKLKQLHLLQTEKDLALRKKAFKWTASVISGLGGAKLCLGFARGRPVIFLVIELLAALAVLWLTLHPDTSKFSRLGRMYLKSLEEKFAWAKISPQSMSPALLVAIFGVGVLAKEDEYAPFSQVFTPQSSGGGGCGGGGCGSGGCGGGGCGGCGGCGG